MKIIFLDIDGVLINRASLMQKKSFDNPDPRCVERFNRIIQQTGAQIVLSSTWRIGRTVVECRELMTKFGVKAKLIDRTPINPSVIRGQEIQSWITEYEKHRDIDEFIILDDDSDMGNLLSHLVKCKFEFGLTDEIADECIRRLNKNSNKA